MSKTEPSFHELLKWGYVYYPLDCVKPNQDKKCLFHFVHHGCSVRAKNMALNYVPIGQANNIVFVFTQAAACWDNVWGFTGDDYLTKKGFHMQYVNNILDRVTAPLDPAHKYDFNAQSEGVDTLDINEE